MSIYNKPYCLVLMSNEIGHSIIASDYERVLNDWINMIGVVKEYEGIFGNIISFIPADINGITFWSPEATAKYNEQKEWEKLNNAETT